MRDLKTLLELLLSEWESTILQENTNMCIGLCMSIENLAVKNSIDWGEALALKQHVFKYLQPSKIYLFPRKKHKERVEWLKERIKELEK